MTWLSLSQIQKRLFAWGLAKVKTDQIVVKNCPCCSNFADLKRQLLRDLQGKVLEIGPGAGSSLAFYPKSVEWIGIEPNPFMHSYLLQEAEQQELKSIELHQATAEELPVEANSIDAVVSFHVLCSVQDLNQSLQEIQRVLKPGGMFVFLEHVAAEPGTWTRRFQNEIQPLWTALFENCYPNRETPKAIERMKFTSIESYACQLPLPIVSPHFV
ncbi:MAG: class I SAM-dependent methyltransferase [Microcoleaceae cyanobacterium]